MKKLIILMSLVALVAAALWFFCGGSGGANRAEMQPYVDAAYAQCMKEVDAEAAALEKWYLRYTESATGAAAEELTGLKAKWVVIKEFGDKDKIAAFAGEVLNRHLFTKKNCEDQTVKSIAAVVNKWAKIEDELSINTKCYELSTSAKADKWKAKPVEVKDDMQKQIKNSVLQEATSLVGGEVAAYAAIQLATSAGILGAGTTFSWPTFGIGLVAAVLVDVVVGWAMDTTGKIKNQLDDQVRKTAADQKKRFREAMLKALNTRKSEWEKQIF